MIQLHLSSSSPLDSLYSAEDGRVVYKVTSSRSLWYRRIVIERITPDAQPDSDEKHFRNMKLFRKRRKPSLHCVSSVDAPPRASSITFVDAPSRVSLESRAISRTMTASPLLYPSMDDSANEPLAELEFPLLKPARIQYKGTSVDPSKLFCQQGWNWFGKSHIFLTPDGRQYKWTLGRRAPQLTLDDETHAPVARFRPARRRFLCFGIDSPAILQIYPAGMNIADLVFMTFIYVEKVRRRRETVARWLGEW